MFSWFQIAAKHSKILVFYVIFMSCFHGFRWPLSAVRSWCLCRRRTRLTSTIDCSGCVCSTMTMRATGSTSCCTGYMGRCPKRQVIWFPLKYEYECTCMISRGEVLILYTTTGRCDRVMIVRSLGYWYLYDDHVARW